MKKVFLFLTMFLFAFVGVTRADEVEIGTDASTSQYLPTYNFYDYSLTQQIYTADEIGMGGYIKSISFKMSSGSSTTRNLNVFMRNVEKSAIASTSDWETFDAGDALFSGNVTVSTGWVTITLNTPFNYDGVSNLLVCVQDVTGSYVSAPSFYVFTGQENCSLYAYRDSSTYPINSPGVSGYLMGKKNHVKLVIEDLGPANLVATENPIEMGYRPNGAWMKPYTATFNNLGGPARVTAAESNNSFFAVNGELPMNVEMMGTAQVGIGTTTGAVGNQSGQIMLMYPDRGFTTVDVNATAYDPVAGDVWETAETVTAMPYSGNAPAGIYKNYDLPGINAAAKDAVYKVTFNEDVMFSAGNRGNNAVTALYNEDFDGVGGPDSDNNYVYNGPTVNPGPMAMWFSYAYTGSNTFMGYPDNRGMYFGYKISAETIAELGIADCSLVTVEAAAREAYPYDLIVVRGGDTPADGDLIYYQPMETAAPALYFFDVNLDEPFVIGDEDIWVLFYSISPYAAYTGLYPVNPEGNILYSVDYSTWYTSTRTPVIYCRFIELPTGREVTMNLADVVLGGNGTSSVAEAVNGEVKGVSKAQTYNDLKAGNANNRGRGVETLTVYDEGTLTNAYVPVYGYYADAYLRCQYVMPGNGLTDMAGSNIKSMTFYVSSTPTVVWDGNFQVYMTEVVDPSISAFIDPSTATMVYEGTLDATSGTMVVTFDTPYMYNGGNLLIGFDHTVTGNYASAPFYGETVNGASVQGYGYSSVSDITPEQHDFLPKTTFTYEVAGSEPNYQIADMFVPAGTYYVATASTTNNFQVNMKADAIPAPEQSIVIAPFDGETGVEAPYLAEWILGDYTTEMQVLVGTQYPPQTALIDWTSELVESAFITELANNQSYYIQVNGRNSAGTTYGEVYAFVTTIDPVEGFAVEDAELYPGDAAVFTWDANRTFKGYNIYMDGVKVNEALITEATYSVEGLEYNMGGYNFAVTAVYDAGESVLSDMVTVYMTGNGTVSGTIYEIDSTTVIPFATVEFRGIDEYNNVQTITMTADENGAYSGDVLAGIFTPYAYKDGYAECQYPEAINIAYGDAIDNINIYVHEFYYPLGQIKATEQENDVLVEWAWTPAELIVDFETGDFSQAEFDNTISSYPWVITTTNPYEGTYCMKSACEGVASATSAIEVTVDVPFDAKMGFYVKVSSESSFDKFYFYIDGVQQGTALSGNANYAYKEFDVTEGTHTYKWAYTKDSSVNANDDCIYVDNIVMYRQDIPLPGGTTYDFNDGTMMGWTSIDADGDGFGWDPSSQPGNYHNAGVNLSGYGHNSSEAFVISGSFSNVYGALNPDNYLVSPSKIAVQNGAYIDFYACAQDAGYPADHFGVAVSTGNATASEFTTIQEWTMTAKGVNTADSDRGARGLRQGSWYQYTVDLSAYAGQEIWVAIRHFNCTDQFILNVDDITLGDGSSKGVTRNDRTFQSFNLYRRDNNSGGEPELIATPAADVFEYTDAEWNILPFGVYQWGIQATYDGNAPVERSREEITYNFDDGTFMSWTAIDADGDGYGWDPSSQPGNYFVSGVNLSGNGHNSSEAYVMSGSYCNLTYLALNPDNYFVSPVKAQYSQISFWACAQDAGYPAEHFGVAVSTTGNTSASNFTTIQEWTLTAKGTSGVQSLGRNGETRSQGNWYQYTADLSAYAGQEIWVAIRHFNCTDQFILNVDDITLTTSSAPVPPVVGGEGLSEILWSNEIEKEMYTTITVNVALNNNQSPAGATFELVGENTYTATADETGVIVLESVRKGEYELTLSMNGYATITEGVAFTANEVTLSYVLEELIDPVEDLYVSPTGLATWAGGAAPVPPTPTPGEGQWYYYGDDVLANIIGASGAFYWAVMFPAGTYTGNMVTKVATYATGYDSFSGSVTIYNDGTTAPSTAVGTMDINVPNTEGFIEFEFPTPVTINPANNLWVVFYNATSTTYIAGACSDAGNANGRWVSIDGNSWTDLATAGIPGYNWMIRAYVASGKGEVTEISVPTMPCSGSALVAMPADRVALSYKVMLDGSFVGETTMAIYQHDVEGMEEGSEHVTAVAPIYASGMGDWMEYTWTYASCSNYAGVTDLTATESGNDVLLTWTLPGSPVPPTPPTGGWTESFENSGIPSDWAIIDADGDGNNWTLASVLMAGYMIPSHSGDDCVSSASYYNGSALTPDNYLVTSQVTPVNGSTFSFWACAQDASYPSEHFGVAVSTGSQTNASDFTTIQEWTMTAKGTSGVQGIGRDGETRDQGSWYQYTVDLSAYAGQNVYLAIRHFNCSDWFYLDVDDVEFTTSSKAIASGRAMWDEIATITCSSAYQYGVVSDGTNIYTCTWSASADAMFYKYDMSGNLIESFNITGCGYCRDITYDGQYFYGVANSSTVYCLDLVNKTLVSTFTTSYGAMRCITYDSQRDGFWVVGNWAGNLTLIDRTGAIQQTGPEPTSASGIGFYTNSDGEDHVLLNCQPTGTGSDRIDDYNITTGAFTEGVHNIVTTSSSGGMHVGDYNGTLACYASCQESPNIIHILELDGTPTPPTPPTPTGDILGVLIYRDGELITSAPVAGTTYTDEGAAGASEYCVRVVYDDYATACPVCAEVAATACDPVTNLVGMQYNNQGTEGILLMWDAPAGAISYNIYQIVDGTAYLLGNLSGDAAFISGIEQSGTYTFGVTAVYANCESDMETVDVVYIIGVEENEIVNAIYPNPTSSDLHINATAMTRVSVYNAMGQMVYDQAVDSDEIIINMGQFEAGVYMVNVVTENGSTVKRITVVK